MSGLVIEKLSKSFGSEQVLEQVSFTVDKGVLAVILGPSGCGKSTLLRLVAGLEEPDQGRIVLAGRDLAGVAPRQRGVAMVFQNYALYPHLDVAANLAFPLKMRHTPRQEMDKLVGEAAAMLGLEGLLAKKPAQLSGGQRQRVAIGRAIVRQPELFLFDEPLSNLDAQLRAQMRLELARLHRSLGTSMLYVTHDQVEAMTLGQVIVLLAGGRVQQIGTPEEVYNRPANRFVAGFLGSPPMNFFEGVIEKGPLFRSNAPRFDCPLEPGPGLEPGRRVVLGLRPEDLTVGSGPLQGRVELVERVGASAILHLSAGETAFTARAPATVQAAPGRDLSLDIDKAHPHLFGEDGLRIA